jgi:hypothetical protein
MASLVLAGSASGWAQTGAATAPVIDPATGPPPSSVGIFPLSQIHKGLTGTAWTVFEGTVPEPMDVEILGVLKGSRGPHRDLILARLHGTKPEYTGVVAGMSGSPVYIDGKLAGALSYRIGQFSKEPIAGITPIEQMLEVRDLPVRDLPAQDLAPPTLDPTAGSSIGHPLSLQDENTEGQNFSAMETPLLMSGFQPEAIREWKQRMAGTGLDVVSAGGASGQAANEDFGPIVPGSAVSVLLASGDLEIAATCTVTYVDPKQLLACGHPIQQSGAISLPMTSTEVVATLASPLNAFKIVNTGKVIGAFTEDRDAAIRGEFGAKANMILLSISVSEKVGGGEKTQQLHVAVLNLPGLTSQVVLVSLYEALLESNLSSADTSYHVTGEIDLKGQAPVPVEEWGTPGATMVTQLAAALGVGQTFDRLYSNAARETPVERIALHVEAIPKDMRTELESVRLVSSSIVHAGDTVTVEATLRPWQQAPRNVRIPFTIPARLEPGTLRLLVGSSQALDRTLDAARPQTQVTSETAAVARLREIHPADQIYVSLLMPESEASMEGRTLDSLPLSMANTLESASSGVEVGLHGESLVMAARAPAGGVLTGQQLLTLRVEAGGGLH